jgi:ATP adenylyltransferase
LDKQRIWAPWRIGYITGSEAPGTPPSEPQRWLSDADQKCFLCRAAAGYADQAQADRHNLVLARDDQTVTLLNLYPYNNGHLLVAPLRHVSRLDELTPAEHLAAMQSLAGFTQRLERSIAAQGFNIGLNLGQIAGAGVPGHLHWHLVPRWSGDTNFMASLAGVRVIPQSLEALWEALSKDLAAGGPDGV